MKFRGLIAALSVIALLSLLATCSLETGFRPASGTELPADQVLDVARSYSGPFTYETLLPVALNLTVQLYQQPSPAAALARQTSDSQLIVVSLRNSKGETLYSGAVPSGGTLATVLSLPAAPQDVVLRLDAPGYEPREVTIDGMVLYSEINRVMGLLSEGLSAKGDLPDTDRDGVPDIYDVDPLDPEAAFKVRTPASGWYTVAFEDLYPVPGDADYNDFVAEYFIEENHVAVVQPLQELLGEVQEKPIEVMLQNLHGEVTAVAKVAGYNHKFGIVIEFPGVQGVQLFRKYYNSSGGELVTPPMQPEVFNDRAVIWLFENTKYAVDKTATFDLLFPKGVTRSMVSIAPYDPVLYVLNTSKDIHMVGKDPLDLPASALADELSYMDSNGYPWALLVPEEWQHPAETQYIGNAYPLFEEWRKSKGANAPYWYLYPASIGSVPGNNPPSPVSYVGSTEKEANSNSPQDFQLTSTDPDGGVQFLCSPPPLALQNLFHLNADSGEIIFDPGVPEGNYLFYFWSMDRYGASNISVATGVTFSFQSKAPPDNNPPAATFPTGFKVDGAGTGAANGYYVANGTFPTINPQTKYTQASGNYSLYSFYYWENEDYNRFWAIDTQLIEYTADLSVFTYYLHTAMNSSAPLESGWSAGTGTLPAPSVLRMPISGTATVGNVLTVHYLFSDPDGDAQGATKFQWYLGASMISGATADKYTPADIGTHYVEVTPVDSHGLAGQTIKSPPIVVGN